MTAAETRPPQAPEPFSWARAVTSATSASSDLSGSPDADIHEFIRRYSFGTQPDAASMREAAWRASLEQLLWGSAYIDWYSPGHRLMISVSPKTGVTEPSTSPGKVLGARPTHCVIDETPSFTPRQVAERVSRRQEQARARALLARYSLTDLYMDMPSGVAYPLPLQPLLELSLASPVFRSPMPSLAGADTR